MPTYYFDLLDHAGDHRDDDGQDLPDLASARRLGLEALGQIIIDDGAKDRAGLKSVIIRDGHGVVLRISADVVVSMQ